MRRISLYIAERLVDLDDDSFILMNYTTEDLDNPTIVRNSFSQTITLKGTPNNNSIFGEFFRLDKSLGYDGQDFNPLVRSPFVVFNEANEVIESGYCKLDSVDRNGADIQYKVSLFGGLGSFLYSLAYDQEGNKRTLADIDYLGTANPETELTFTINKESVAEAWDTDQEDVTGKWNVINFAPAYNGIPEGDFDAQKAIVVPSAVGLANSVDGYGLRSGYSLVKLAEKHDEWAMKDLRSYMQRPILSMKAFIKAICRPENNGGYIVNADALEDTKLTRYLNTWLTLPMIPSLGTSKRMSGALSLSLTDNYLVQEPAMGRFVLDGSVPFGTKIESTMSVRLKYSLLGRTESSFELSATKTEGRNVVGKQSVIFLQAVAYGSDDTIVGGSKVKSLYDWPNTSPSEMAKACGYEPLYVGSEGFESRSLPKKSFNKVSGLYEYPDDIVFNVNCPNVAYYTIDVRVYEVDTLRLMDGGDSRARITSVSGGDTCLARLFKDYGNSYVANNGQVFNGSEQFVSYVTSATLRSGAVITKAMLLSSSRTPADYLVSFCKMLGLRIMVDNSTKVVNILPRNDFFRDEVIDITPRIDLSQGVSINPFVFDSKWYDFNLDGVGGAYLEEYKSVHGLDYGVQRVDTSYDFNADSKNVLDGNAFKNAVTILDKSRYYNTILAGGSFRPSVFLDQGNTYTLWNGAGESKSFDINAVPTTAYIFYLNEYGHQGQDVEFARKVEFRTADNKPIDGTDVLLFWEGYNRYEYFSLTDDLPAMDVLNDGKPCWLMTPGGESGIIVPIFQRYTYRNNWTIDNSLDFGVPKEMDIPQITYKEDATLYSRFWKAYLRDRYNVDTRVMTCRVDLSGLKVGNDLLRSFYWFAGSLWVMNAIRNYSLTTWDTAECEFVRVMDKDNYLNGQDL